MYRNRLKKRLEKREASRDATITAFNKDARIIKFTFMEKLGPSVARNHHPRVWMTAHTASDFLRLTASDGCREDGDLRPGVHPKPEGAPCMWEFGVKCHNILLLEQHFAQQFAMDVVVQVADYMPADVHMCLDGVEIHDALTAMKQDKLTTGAATKNVGDGVHEIEIWVRPKEILVRLHCTVRKSGDAIDINISEIVYFRPFAV